MKDYYCFDISFSGIDLDTFMPGSKQLKPKHHAHIYITKNEIELKIFFEPLTCLSYKFMLWSSRIKWKSLGSYIVASNETQNENILKFDFSASALTGAKRGSNQFEGGLEYLIIRIDSVKYYWKANDDIVNTAEFYFNDAGFKVVKDFYSTLFGFDNEFSFNRMQGMDVFYPIGKAEFRPEFNFVFADNRSNKEALITKEPKLQFRYKEPVSESEALLYGETLCLVASFYFHTKIDFSSIRIHLNKYTVTQKKIQKKNYFETTGGLRSFKLNWDFHKFLQSDWQTNTFLNFKKLSKIVPLFNQALLVDNHSAFLIAYNIIEICADGKLSSEKFKEILKGKARKKKYKDALNNLLDTISPDDHKEFINRWNSMSGNLSKKPMKNPLQSFFEKHNFKLSEFPISVEELKQLRDNITHGSIDEINYEQLEKANIFLYRITGCLILNLMGIKDWKLDTKIFL